MDIRPQGRWKATDKQMKAKWQSHQSDFKAKVEVEELTWEYLVHPTQVSQWKRVIVGRLPKVFDREAITQAEASEHEVAGLDQQVGQLTMALECMKKFKRSQSEGHSPVLTKT